jgi:glycosyltransferase involved in cell wall biosynthesis
MKFLFCTPLEITKYVGISHVFMGLRDALVGAGHDVALVGVDEIGCDVRNLATRERFEAVSAALARYLKSNADRYDVVEYDHEHLPIARSEFPARPLFVARSALLVQHLLEIRPPGPRTVRSVAGGLLRRATGDRDLELRVRYADQTVRAADRVNVSNRHDRAILIRRGVPAERILVFPYGMSAERSQLFADAPGEPPREPVLAFVGTFDYRKGAMHFGPVLSRVALEVPGVRLRLLGARGLLRTPAQVLAHFPPALRDRIDLHMSFDRDHIAELLRGASLGIFPTYVEGFPFAVMEMMAAGLPVVAFDSPGPSMIVPEELLVGVGDEALMAERVIQLLKDENALRAARARATRLAAPFTWQRIAGETLAAYEAAIRSRA